MLYNTEKLTLSIIEQAITDYEAAKRKIEKLSPNGKEYIKQQAVINEVSRFFASEWGYALSNGKSESIFEKINSNYDSYKKCWIPSADLKRIKSDKR